MIIIKSIIFAELYYNSLRAPLLHNQEAGEVPLSKFTL